MVAEKLINDMVPALTTKDSAEKAILWMGELRTNFLPVLENSHFKGFLSEDLIFENNDLEKTISEIKLIAENCYLSKHQHFYDIIKLFKDFSIDMVAILDDDETYLGVVTIEDVINAFSQTSAVQNQGGIIILSLRLIDYSLAEVSRLIEENSLKILSSYLSSDPKNRDMAFLTIKVNTTEIDRAVATLERFNYSIVAQFKETNTSENHNDRLNLLLKYINI